MKVIGYARVSTSEQSTEGHSLAAQEAKLRAYAACFDLELVEIIVDAGQSAKSLNRPGLQRALAALEAGQAQGLLVAKLDRLTRSVRDLDFLVATYFERRFSLMSIGEQVDTRSATGKMMLNLLAVVSQWERQVIGERTSAALQHLKAQGVKLGQKPLEGGAVTRAQELHSQGRTLRQIAEVLTAEGHPTKRGGSWAPQTVSLLLKRAA